MTLKQTLMGILAIATFSLTAWSTLLTTHSLKSKNHLQQNLPDAIMEDIVATTLNKQGTPKMRVVTPKMTHYAENDVTDILSPIVTVFRPSANPWSIRASHAKATQGIEKILFWNHVIIHHDADVLDPNTTMLTEALTVFPDRQIAATDQAITITQPDSTIRAVGMLANMENGSVKLLSQTQGEYVPNL